MSAPPQDESQTFLIAILAVLATVIAAYDLLLLAFSVR